MILLTKHPAPKYQTIVLKGKTVRNGSEKCHISWNNILNTGIDFKDKYIYDLGCFNGFFSFSLENMGAKKVTGVDNNDAALNISKSTF